MSAGWIVLALAVTAFIGFLWRAIGREKAPVRGLESAPADVSLSPASEPAERVLYATQLAPGIKMEVFARHRPTPRSEDYFLSRFRTLERIDHYTAASRLDGSLGRSRWAVLDEFDSLGLTRIATPTEVLGHEHTLESLKSMCRAQGLKVSGKKADVIARLLAANPYLVTIEQCSAYRVLTDAGVARMDRYFRDEERDWNAAATGIVAALDEGDLSAAVAIAESYNDSAIYPVMTFRGAQARDFIAGMWATPHESRATRIHAVLLGTIGTDYPGKWWVEKNEGLSKA